MRSTSGRRRLSSLLGSLLLLGSMAAASPPPGLQAAPWQQGGQDILIAVVGSGVDYYHQALGGSGDPADYDADDPGQVEDGSFPTARVVGGWDLAGDRYSADCPAEPPPDWLCSRRPMPDPDPLDGRAGIGTRMAGVVIDHRPGVGIVALKVIGDPIGPPATSRLYDEAIDWVLRHNAGEAVPGAPPGGRRIDVILLDAGQPYGQGRAELEAMAERASEAGISLIAPVGDAGGERFGAAGNAAAPDVLSVAAAVTEAPTSWGIEARYPDAAGGETARPMEAVEGGDWLPQLADVGPVSGELAWYGLACNDDQGLPLPPEQPMAGRVALIERGECPFTDKMNNAAEAGAIAVVIFTDDRDKVGPACGGGCTADPGIPGVMIDRQPGLDLRQLLLDGQSVSVLLDADYRFAQDWLVDTLVEDSGSGPVAGGGFAPDLSAGGSDISVPVAGGGDQRATWSSSSLAAARVAALAAEAHALARAEGWRERAFDRAVVPALLASQARPELHLGRSDSGPLAPTARQGAGIVQPEVISRTQLVAMPAEDHGIDFGLQRVAETRQLQASVLFRQLAGENAILRPDFAFTRPGSAAAGAARVSLGQALRMDDSRQAERSIGLRIDPAELPEWNLPPGGALAEDEALAEHVVDGHLRFQAVDEQGQAIPDQTGLVVPFEILPMRASCVEPEALGSASVGQQARSSFENPCVTAGRLRAMPLSGSDPEEADTTFPRRVRALDIRAVGIRYGRLEQAEGPPEGMLEFHIATAERRDSPLEAGFDVLLDIDRDGRFERALTSQPGQALRDTQSDLWYTANAPLIPGSLEPDLLSAAPDPLPLGYELGEAVSVLRVRAADLLLDFESGEEAFDFALRSRDPLGLMPTNAALPGYDLAPDGLERGEAYRFDQRATECLIIEDGAGQPAGGLEQDLRLEAGAGRAELGVSLRADCRVETELLPAGLLLSMPDNASALEQVIIWTPFGQAALRPLYLPLGLASFELPR